MDDLQNLSKSRTCNRSQLNLTLTVLRIKLLKIIQFNPKYTNFNSITTDIACIACKYCTYYHTM